MKIREVCDISQGNIINLSSLFLYLDFEKYNIWKDWKKKKNIKKINWNIFVTLGCENARKKIGVYT